MPRIEELRSPRESGCHAVCAREGSDRITHGVTPLIAIASAQATLFGQSIGEAGQDAAGRPPDRLGAEWGAKGARRLSLCRRRRRPIAHKRCDGYEDRDCRGLE
jgi:hypothetical protein